MLQFLTTNEDFFLVLGLWFLGLIEHLCRAAEVSNGTVNSGAELKSNGSSAASAEELVGPEKGLNGVGS